MDTISKDEKQLMEKAFRKSVDSLKTVLARRNKALAKNKSDLHRLRSEIRCYKRVIHHRICHSDNGTRKFFLGKLNSVYKRIKKFDNGCRTPNILRLEALYTERLKGVRALKSAKERQDIPAFFAVYHHLK